MRKLCQIIFIASFTACSVPFPQLLSEQRKPVAYAQSTILSSSYVGARVGEAVQNIPPGFWTPSKNIVCGVIDDEHLRCEIRSMLNPEPPQPYPGYCQSDWAAGFELTRNGEPNILCISDTIANNYPTLSYGSTWKNAGFECVSQKIGLTCTNPSGQGFFLSRERWKILAIEPHTAGSRMIPVSSSLA